jgi:ABC-type multidrug transport system ATPase subunit
LLGLAGIHVAYRNTTVLEEASASFPRGTVSGVIGANGAGKTTLFLSLCGAVGHSKGEVRLDGGLVDVSDPEWKRRITLIADDNALFGDLTVKHHFDLMSILYGVGRDESDDRRDALVTIFGLTSYLAAAVDELSFGYRKRLAIALALFRDADVYLFDEPFNGLDVGSLNVFRSVIDRLTQARRVVIIASHAVELIYAMCSDVWSITSGNLTYSRDGVGVERVKTSSDESHALLDTPWLISWDT